MDTINANVPPSETTEDGGVLSVMTNAGNSTLAVEAEQHADSGASTPLPEGMTNDPPSTHQGGTVRPGLPRFTTSKENVLSQFFIGSIDQGTTSTR